MKTVGVFKDSVAGLLTGLSLDNVTGLENAIERSARIMATLIDVPEASGRQEVTLYGGVYDYTAPTTIFGSSVTDFRPQGVDRTPNDMAYKMPVSLFDQTKLRMPNGYGLTFEYKKGTPILRVSSPKPTSRALLDPMNDDSDWVDSGSASNLVADETVYYESPASLRFLLTGSSTGILTKTLNSTDLTSYEDVAVGFLAIRTPSIANLTSIAVRVGSSASAYDEVTETEGFLGAWVVDEWTVVAFDFSAATSTGTPNWAALTHLQVRIAHTGTITNFRVGGFWLSLPSPHEILFQSAAIFMASGSNPSASITNDNDSIILNDAAYVIFEHVTAKVIALQQSGGEYTTQIKGFDEALYGNQTPQNPGLIPMYRANNPSQQLRTTGSWYD